MSEPNKRQHSCQNEKRFADRRTWAWALPLAIISLAIIAFLYLS